MNNILSDGIIEQIESYNLGEIKKLFTDVLNDPDYSERRAQRLGVNQRLRLEPATQYCFGREADGVPVLIRPESKNISDPTILVNLKTHKDYPNIITGNKSGYMSGITPNSTVENDPTLETVNQFLNMNTFKGVYNDLIKKSCAYGVKALRLYSDTIRGLIVSELEPWDYAPFYDKTGHLVAVLQWEKISRKVSSLYNDGKYKVLLTTRTDDIYMIQSATTAELSYNSYDYPAKVITEQEYNLQNGIRPHLFKGVPVVEFKNNMDALGDVEKTLDSQDIRDELMSKASTTWTAFTDAMLVDKTQDSELCSIEDFIKQMRDFGIASGDISWISKDYTGYDNLQKHYSQLERDIYESSNSYDPNSLGGDGNSPTAFQIKQKMKGLSNAAVDTETQFTSSLQELFRLVLTYGIGNSNESWKNLGVDFQYTIPEDKVETLKKMKEAGAMIPQQTIFEAGGYDWAVIEPLQKEEQEAFGTNFDNGDNTEVV